MMWLKSCPRCGGDLYTDKDVYGSYIACLQCGHYLTEAEEVVLRYVSSRQPVGRSEVAASAELVVAGAGGETRAHKLAA